MGAGARALRSGRGRARPPRAAAAPATQPVERDRLLEALGRRSRTRLARPATTVRDRKELLRTLIEEVIIAVDRDKAAAVLTHALAQAARSPSIDRRPAALAAAPTIRTDEDTIALRAPPRGPLSRRRHRRHPQSPGPHHGPRPSLHGAVSSATCAATGRFRARVADRPAGGRAARRSGRRPSSSASPPRPSMRCLNDGIIRRRAADTRCSLADPSRPKSYGSASPATSGDGFLPCAKPSVGSASRARPCCSVSSAANSSPSTSCAAREKASTIKVVPQPGLFEQPA